MPKIIALVGHCGIDGPRLQSELTGILPGVQVVRCNDQHDLDELCQSGVNLLLLNRQLVGEFDVEEGLNLLQSIRARHPGLRTILVSDHPDAQEQARAAGALPGFGKSQSVAEYGPAVKSALA